MGGKAKKFFVMYLTRARPRPAQRTYRTQSGSRRGWSSCRLPGLIEGYRRAGGLISLSGVPTADRTRKREDLLAAAEKLLAEPTTLQQEAFDLIGTPPRSPRSSQNTHPRRQHDPRHRPDYPPNKRRLRISGSELCEMGDQLVM